MNLNQLHPSGSSAGARLTLAALLCFLGLAAAPARPQPAAGQKPPAPTPAAPTNSIPLSVFVLPSSNIEGRDPFFPNSTRFTPVVPVHTNNSPPVAVFPELQFKGVSGPADHLLAIINNRTFQAGEEAEVMANTGKVKVRCLEIKPDSVEVQVGSERRLLHLRSGI